MVYKNRAVDFYDGKKRMDSDSTNASDKFNISTCVTAKGPHGQAGKSNIAHLYLYEKDPISWNITENGSWGKMKYELSGETFDFVFNGHNLTPFENYTLIYYPNPWPGDGLICLGSDMVCEEGNVHIAEKVNTGSLPLKSDENFGKGAKIWLVLSSDVDCDLQKMIGWTPESYLFEYELIEFSDTDERSYETQGVDDEPKESEDDDVDEKDAAEESEDDLDEESHSEEKLFDSSEGKVDTGESGQKNKFGSNTGKLREVFRRVFTRMSEQGKEELPPGIQRIYSLLSDR